MILTLRILGVHIKVYAMPLSKVRVEAAARHELANSLLRICNACGRCGVEIFSMEIKLPTTVPPRSNSLRLCRIYNTICFLLNTF